jgi:hypothetical protein
MIIVRNKKHSFAEGRREKNWFDFILDNLSSDEAFDILFNIFAGCPYAQGPLLSQAVALIKKVIPSVPNNEIARFVRVWVEHHEEQLKNSH